MKPTGECTCGDGFQWDDNDLRCESQPQFLYVESDCKCLGGWSIFGIVLGVIVGLATCLCVCMKICN